MTNLAKTNHFDPLLEGEREELTAAVETTHDMYTEDTIADPEGAEAREEYVAEYPQFVFNNFEVSSSNIWGRPFKDGKQHLRPTANFIAEIQAEHEEGETNIPGMLKLAEAEEAERIASLTDNFGDIVRSNPYEEYSVIMAVKGIAEEKLANRAFQKQVYNSIAEKEQRTGKPNPGYTADEAWGTMQTAAVRAGVWYLVWEEVISAAGGTWFKTNDVKLNVEYAVKKLAQGKADQSDRKHRTEKARVPTLADYKSAISF